MGLNAEVKKTTVYEIIGGGYQSEIFLFRTAADARAVVLNQQGWLAQVIVTERDIIYLPTGAAYLLGDAIDVRHPSNEDERLRALAKLTEAERAALGLPASEESSL